MAKAEQEAQQLIKDAEKKMSSKGFFRSLFGYYKYRTQDAIESYEKAGNLFKMARNWLQAGSAFKVAGDLHLEQNNRTEAANAYVLAGKCVQKYDINSAVHFLLSAIAIYTDLGRFLSAARLHDNIAKMYENSRKYAQALHHYEQAADFFKVEENYSAAKKCMLKIAQYASSELHDYNKAIAIYQEIAFYDLKTPVLQYSAKDSLFKAGICHLCLDTLNARDALDTYVRKYPGFSETREYMFLKAIINCMEDSDESAFNKAVKECDDLSRLDAWHAKMLLVVKSRINDPPSLL